MDPPGVLATSPLKGRFELFPKCRNLPMKPPPLGVLGVWGIFPSLSLSLDPGPPQPEKSSGVVAAVDTRFVFKEK
jgi:hypothetical protein